MEARIADSISESAYASWSTEFCYVREDFFRRSAMCPVLLLSASDAARETVVFLPSRYDA